ncbi:RDD family protein [Cellulomonas sp. NS3]|uniref:RDD family protein n=1 Tax=Cellulomonas sp. NS3 TaxID=2973977 RepID=UPI002161F146|nr:RDD family protein [Cellulomonas sp. NS3]
MSTVPRVRAQPPATESLAGTGRRVLALLVDQLVALLLAAGASSIGYGLALDAVRSSATDEVAPEVGAILALPLVVLAVYGIAQWVAEAFTGRTLGGLALGVRTVDADTGLTVGLVRIFVRNLVLGLGSLVCGVGQFVVGASGAWDAAGRLQGWHDKVARTVVVRTGTGEPAVARAPRTEPGRRAADLSARTTNPAAEAPRRASGSGGAESLMRAARAGAAVAASSAAGSTAPASTAPVTASVPGLVGAAPRPDTDADADADALAGRRGEDPTPPTGTARGRLAPEPARPSEAAPAPSSEAAPAPEPEPAPAPTIDVPTWSTALPVAPPPAAAPSEVITAAPSWDDLLPQPGVADTDPRPRPGVPDVDPGAEPAVAQAAPLDVQTPTAPTRRLRTTAPLADPLDAPATDGDAVAPEGRTPADRTPAVAPTARGVRLVFDTGEAVTVVGRGVVGRNPSTADSGVVAHVVPIDDPARSVSKTHLEFGADDGAFWVLDRRSTNGSALVHADGTRERLTAGVRTAVPVGAVVEFGDRRFRVLDA